MWGRRLFVVDRKAGGLADARHIECGQSGFPLFGTDKIQGLFQQISRYRFFFSFNVVLDIKKSMFFYKLTKANPMLITMTLKYVKIRAGMPSRTKLKYICEIYLINILSFFNLLIQTFFHTFQYFGGKFPFSSMIEIPDWKMLFPGFPSPQWELWWLSIFNFPTGNSPNFGVNHHLHWNKGCLHPPCRAGVVFVETPICTNGWYF